MTSVYLDTNILIMGSKKEEHNVLKKLSKEGKLYLYVSDHCNLELHGKVFPLLEKKDEALRLYRNFIPSGNGNLDKATIKYVDSVITEYEKARKNEGEERNFWSDVRLLPINSSFSYLWSIAGFDSQIDTLIKKDFEKVDDLLMRGMGGFDAFHIIQAYSGRIKIFLTWDEKLVKKSSRVGWLKDLCLITPKDFLKSFYRK